MDNNTVNNFINRIQSKRKKRGEPDTNESILTIEEVCARLKDRGGYTGSFDDLIKHIRMFFNEMSYQLSDGFTVNTGYFSIHPVDEENGAPFQTRNLTRRTARSVVIDVDEKKNRGYIKYFTDTGTGLVNERVTPGSLFITAGRKIKIEGNNPDCGVWFVSIVDPSLRFKVMKDLEENSSGKVSGFVPIIPTGKYAIEIKTQYAEGGVLLKELRTIRGGFVLRNYKILSIKDEEESS